MDFIQILKHIHGYLGVLAGLLLLIVVIFSIVKYFSSDKTISNAFRKLSLFTLICFHLQLVLGILVLFTNNTINENITQYAIQGKMSVMEHLFSNFLAVLFVTLFYSTLKRSLLFNTKMILFLVLALLFLSRTFMLYKGVIQP